MGRVEIHRANLSGRDLAVGDIHGHFSRLEAALADAGFDPVVVGGLARARDFDVGTKVYTRLLTAKQLRAELGLKEQVTPEHAE